MQSRVEDEGVLPCRRRPQTEGNINTTKNLVTSHLAFLVGDFCDAVAADLKC
jgi:hypothetical protein